MAQDGDTITYTPGDEESNFNARVEDISSVNEATVEFLEGGGAEAGDGGNGGLVENTVIDLTGQDTLYIWPATVNYSGGTTGRYGNRGNSFGSHPGGSAEVSFDNTNQTDGVDTNPPFLVGAGGGGGGGGFYSGPGGARGGEGNENNYNEGADGASTAPPQGGDAGQLEGGEPDGDGAIASRPEIKSAGTTTLGGAENNIENYGGNGDGDVRITYTQAAPPTPTNVTVSDSQTEDELTISWDTVEDAAGYYVYRSETSGSTASDYTQVADVTSSSYTDTRLEDGEEYYYRVSGHD